MIEREILEAGADGVDGGERVNEIVDQFRRGRDMNDVIVLLDSSNPELVSIGAWIVGELHFEFYNSDTFISRLRKLLDSEDPAIRFHALGAIYPALNPHEAATQALLRRLCNDPNEGVRMAAAAAAARLSLA